MPAIIKRRVREWLCRLGVDAACYHTDAEDREGEARMKAIIWRFEAAVAEVLGDARQR